MIFQAWLEERHPEVRLTTMQREWIAIKERGEEALWSGGRATGKTFVFKLWKEFMERTPRVYNKRDPNVPADAVYVGRPTKWGNPYSHQPGTMAIHKVDTREEAIESYRRWMNRANQFTLRIAAVQELKGKNLVCWCAPLPCHADVLLEIANG